MGEKPKPELDEATRRIAERMLHTPPKRHEDMRVSKPKKAAPSGKERPASKGRVNKGRTRD